MEHILIIKELEFQKKKKLDECIFANVGKNEILDETYSGDTKIQQARKIVRKAFYIKSALPASTNSNSLTPNT